METRAPQRRQHHQVRDEIGQGMDGVGEHGAGTAHGAGDELEAHQQQVGHASHEGHLVYFLFPRHFKG